MNKIKKIVGASVAGAMVLMPVGSAYAQMTGANIEDFYTMPLIVSRISYDDNYFGLVLRKKAVYLNIAVADPGYAEEFVNVQYESMGQKTDRWWRTLYNGDLSGFVVNEEKILTTASGVNFRDDGLGLIYYAMGFEDGSHFEGKISYRSCKEAFDNGEYSGEDYECRVHYEEGEMELKIGEGGESYMSSYTAEKYDGSGKIATWYTYDPALKTGLMTGLPDDVKTAEQVKLEETVQLLTEQQAQNLAEIDRLRDELYEREMELTMEIDGLNTEIDNLEAGMSGLGTEISELETEISDLETKISSLEGEISSLEVEISGLEAEIEAYQTALAAETKKWQDELTKKETEWQDELAKKEAEWQTATVENEAEWQAAIAQNKAEWQAAIEQSKAEWQTAIEQSEAKWQVAIEQSRAELALKETELTELETIRTMEIEAIKTQLASLTAKLAVEPTASTKTVYVDREVATEADVASEDVAAAVSEEIGDEVESEGERVFEEMTPELNKGADKPWWVLLPVGAAVCGLAYWWLSSGLKLKKKK